MQWPCTQGVQGAAAERGPDGAENQGEDDGSVGSSDLGYDEFVAVAMADGDAADEPSRGGQVQTQGRGYEGLGQHRQVRARVRDRFKVRVIFWESSIALQAVQRCRMRGCFRASTEGVTPPCWWGPPGCRWSWLTCLHHACFDSLAPWISSAHSRRKEVISKAMF